MVKPTQGSGKSHQQTSAQHLRMGRGIPSSRHPVHGSNEHSPWLAFSRKVSSSTVMDAPVSTTKVVGMLFTVDRSQSLGVKIWAPDPACLLQRVVVEKHILEHSALPESTLGTITGLSLELPFGAAGCLLRSSFSTRHPAGLSADAVWLQ